ncbi:GAF domain-containing protein [Thalassotalea litorea]|uniref:GAF domain-containing protein n=1 Tax=Thalassotalea litorea TaxID=2020715 RepID=A0A5R9IU75_9GAMM|nr:GAF domain-containing protein [Thalassotalea litorea]TLU68063.1 GAF domain-containing protein [Thalassotalea litorea]
MDKREFYQTLVQQVDAITAGETDVIANMANISAILFNALDDVNWVGFYRLDNNELILGPFQGQVACIRIPVGKGVCGSAVSEGKIQVVEDVHQFSGHIACDAASNSEIVLPVYVADQCIAVLDIDSTAFAKFDQHDAQGLQQIVDILQERCQS